MSYWETRRQFRYYRQMAAYLRQYCPAGAILDVGGGIAIGARYLIELPEYDRTSIELLRDEKAEMKGVRVIRADFMEWTPDRQYDAVLCLQVLEHVVDPAAFSKKVLITAPVAIISVPYLWPKGSCKYHLHDEIDLAKLTRWMGRKPDAWQIVQDEMQRLVVAYGQIT